MSLTYEVQKTDSHVAVWLRTTFPHSKPIQTAYRMAAGPALVVPSAAVAHATQGAAIDWWLRLMLDPAPSLALPLTGVLLRRRLPCFPAGLDLLAQLGVEPQLGVKPGPYPTDPSRFSDQSDEWWARVSYALALLVELYRAPTVDGSRLMTLGPDSRAADLLALANDDEVADLIAMRDLAVTNLLPALPPGRPITGMTFDGSADLAADGDLIINGVLIDIKASQGGNRRADGTRACLLARRDLDQLIGYTLMDYSDTFSLQAVSIYATRFGHYTSWSLLDLTTQLAGHPVDLPTLRQEFARVLRALRDQHTPPEVWGYH